MRQKKVQGGYHPAWLVAGMAALILAAGWIEEPGKDAEQRTAQARCANAVPAGASVLEVTTVESSGKLETRIFYEDRQGTPRRMRCYFSL
jgi:hypothetical protein